MSIISRWWYRPVPRRRAVTVLVLLLVAAVLFVWQAIAYGSTATAVIGWICAALLAIDAVRVSAGLTAGRYPRE
jgi:hypothetical protein